MIDYVFHVFSDGQVGAVVLRHRLASDIEASVKSFDLLKHHPAYSRVVVLRDQEQIFRRARLGGKIDIGWTPGIRRLTAAGAEAPDELHRVSRGSEG
jgi:hypothetical protein